jgi:hypothetical protein
MQSFSLHSLIYVHCFSTNQDDCSEPAGVVKAECLRKANERPEYNGTGRTDMAGSGEVIVEFFGVPRLRAGREELAVPPGTITDVLAAIERACPGLMGLRLGDGRLSPHYLVSLNGQAFLSDLQRAIHAGDRLLLLSADAGG